MSRLVFAAVCLAVSAVVVPLRASTVPLRPMAVVLDDASPATRQTAAAGIARLGGRVIHAFNDLLVVELPAGSELRAYRLRGVKDVILNAAPTAPRKGAPSPFGLAAWNAIAAGTSDADRIGLDAEALHDDALVPPIVSIEAVRAASAARRGGLSEQALATAGGPYGATDLNTSEFLAGSVSINLILVESDGTAEMQSENWSAAREAEVVGKVAAGLEWVRTQEPQAALRFVYHVYPGRTDTRARTGYEPIRRPADPNGIKGEDLWVREILGKFGYASGDRFARSRAFAADTRRADGTDWAVNVFVVDSLSDTDGKFADSWFAYTWISGPHVVMTYDNQAWGIGRMDMVIRHELLHAFYAFDEYQASACTCTEHRGYLDGVNANCNGCNAIAGACVMIANGDAMCDATRRQLGWADLDGDGVIDVVGEDPDTFLDAVPAVWCAPPKLSGLATVVAATNRNTLQTTPQTSISVGRIAGVDVRADGASWTAAVPDGGGWGRPQAGFSAIFPDLALGSHRLEARAIDDYGNKDLAPGTADVVVQAPAAPLGDSVRAGKGAAGSMTITWTACSGAALYRVYRRTTPNGAESRVAELAGLSFTDASAGAGYYQVRPVDACGTEEAR